MKSIIIRIIKVIFALAVLSACVYVEENLFRGSSIIFGGCLCCGGLFIDELLDRFDLLEWDHFLSLCGGCLSFAFLISIALTLHIEHTDDGVIVRSAFYTRVLEKGDSVVTLYLHPYYQSYYSDVESATKKYYFLYRKDSCSIYSEYEKIVTIPTPFKIRNQDFGAGILDYIQVDGKCIDLRGHAIDSLYKPKVINTTPDFSTSFTNL